MLRQLKTSVRYFSKGSQQDFYKILQCSPNSSQETIKGQFRRLAFKFHPDAYTEKGLSDSEMSRIQDQFIQIKQAYDVLSSESDKKVFDRSIGNSAASEFR